MSYTRRLVLALAAAAACAAAPPGPTRGRSMRPVVRGRFHAAASMKPEASQVAEHILRAGGNAFDAAVAGQAVLAQVDGAGNGVGSDAVLLVYDAKSNKVYSINAEGTAPKLATIDWYKANHGGTLPDSDTLLSGTVPGVVDAWYILLDRWGSMSFEQVLAPAIEIAENGFPLSDGLAGAITGSKKLRKYPSSVEVYYPGGRQRWSGGEIFRNPDLARTLKALVEAERASASKGRKAALKAARDRFYKGDLAQAMAGFSEEAGGLFRYQDFAGYTAKVEEPVWIDYRGYRIYKNASATQGPAELFLLNILEQYDLKGLGHNSADYIHASAEAAKLAFADRDKYLGDMDFISIPYAGLLSKEYARRRKALIDPAKASFELRPGVPEEFMRIQPLDRPLDYTVKGPADHEGDTSYLAVIDRDRNMVSFTPSLHNGFGTNVVMRGLGFTFNCRGDYYSLQPGNANSLEPGRRPRSTLQSTLVMKDGKPLMVMGSPGGDDQCLRTVQTLLNMVEFGMNIQQAIEAPRWTTRSFPSSVFPHTMYPGDLGVEDRVPETVRAALSAKGHKLRVVGGWSLGMNAAIRIDPDTGVLSAGADPRADAYAVAW